MQAPQGVHHAHFAMFVCSPGRVLRVMTLPHATISRFQPASNRGVRADQVVEAGKLQKHLVSRAEALILIRQRPVSTYLATSGLQKRSIHSFSTH